MSGNDVKEFTVIRSQWNRGASGTDRQSHLKNEHGFCCLGFLGLACGLSEDDMFHVGSPASGAIVLKIQAWPASLLSLEKASGVNSIENSKVCFQIIEANDSTVIDDKEREIILTNEFASIGIKVNFVD